MIVAPRTHPVDMQVAAEGAAAEGVDFLLKHQGRDGMWRDFMTPAGEASCWPTGVVLSTLRAATSDHSKLARAASALIERQQPDGGWGYNEETPSDADSTSWAVLALCCDGFPQTNACTRAAAFLERHRRRNGGIATYAGAGSIRQYTSLPRWLPFRGWCQPTVEVTATATRALRATDAASASGWSYIRSGQRPDGSWPAYWWITPHLATQQAVMLAGAVGDADALERAARWAIRVLDPNEPGFNVALCLSIIATAAPQNSDAISRAIKILHNLQLADGSWPSVPILRVPVPADTGSSDQRRLIQFDGGLEVADQHRIFTTSTCVAALSQASQALTAAAR